MHNVHQTLRHTVYASSYVRVQLLLSVGKTRQAAGNPNPHFVLHPLQKALQIAFETGHYRDVMRQICIELLECYGNPQLPVDCEEAVRLRLAMAYLVTAIRLVHQHHRLSKQVVDVVSADKSSSSSAAASAVSAASVGIPADLALIMAACSSSSMTMTREMSQALAAAAAAGQSIRTCAYSPSSSSSSAIMYA